MSQACSWKEQIFCLDPDPAEEDPDPAKEDPDPQRRLSKRAKVFFAKLYV